MSDNEEARPDGQANGKTTLDLNFAPSWARTSPEENIQRFQNERYTDDDGPRRGGRDYGRDRRAPREADDRDRRKPDRRPPPRRDFDRGPRPPDDMPRPESRAAVADLRGPRPEGGGGFRPGGGGGGGGGGGDRPPRRDFRPSRPEAPPLPLEIRVLPEQKALGAVIRRIQTSHRAFPLRDIAWLFLDNPASCLVRVEPQKDQQVPLFQCKVCGMPALSEEEIRSHIVNRHMDDFFDVEDVTCEPPSGVFVCVARCGLSGELLGPPNHHSFGSKVQEMLRTRYPNMSEETYRSRIETAREPEVIEQWRQQCTKKKIYRRKGAAPTVAEPVSGSPAEGTEAVAEADSEPAPKAPPMERDVAELVFLREILPEQVASVRHLVCTAAVGMQTPSRPLYYAMKEMLTRERRFPASLFFALRGAFRHRKLYLFRVNDPKGQDFVMLKVPTVLDPAHTVQTLRDVLAYVGEHPACTKVEMVTAIAGSEEEKVKETLVQLAWLVERGHVVEFYNDVLSAPLEYPAFRFLPGEKQSEGYQGGARQAPPPAAPAPAIAKPAAKAATAPVESVAEAAIAPVEPATEAVVAPVEPATEEAVAPVESVTEEAVAPVESATEAVAVPVEQSAAEAVVAPVEPATEGEAVVPVESAAETATILVESAAEEAVVPAESVTEAVAVPVVPVEQSAVEEAVVAPVESATEEVAVPVEPATEAVAPVESAAEEAVVPAESVTEEAIVPVESSTEEAVVPVGSAAEETVVVSEASALKASDTTA
jgi:hypothetical protein